MGSALCRPWAYSWVKLRPALKRLALEQVPGGSTRTPYRSEAGARESGQAHLLSWEWRKGVRVSRGEIHTHSPLSAPAPSVCKEAVVSPVKVLELGRHWEKEQEPGHRAGNMSLGCVHRWAACSLSPHGKSLGLYSHRSHRAIFKAKEKKKSGLHLGEMNGIWQVEASAGSCLPYQEYGGKKNAARRHCKARGEGSHPPEVAS